MATDGGVAAIKFTRATPAFLAMAPRHDHNDPETST
jgi:hypothetical protein